MGELVNTLAILSVAINVVEFMLMKFLQFQPEFHIKNYILKLHWLCLIEDMNIIIGNSA